MEKNNTLKIQIKGVVQGVGFRPFVYNLAQKLGVQGFVLNDSSGVEIGAQAASTILKDFVDALQSQAPPHAKIDSFKVTPLKKKQKYSKFLIRQSNKAQERNVRISPDLVICADCIKELLNSKNRRYYYPFINCTNCGPRYSIIKDVPYDRKFTTMNKFAMCPACAKEYHDPTNRRFHAQPNACHECGPCLAFYNSKGKLVLKAEDSLTNKELIKKTAKLLRAGKIIAIKGIGGFHLACDARNYKSVKNLRARKYREHKPFALMVKDIKAACKLAEISPAEQTRLQDYDRPILLVPKRAGNNVAEPVAPNNQLFGIMLAYTPFHYLLFEYIDFPLVMTSGNKSDEPIAYTNKDALERLKKICDFFILGNRDIYIRCDDSVARIYQERDYPLRRSRGEIPDPIKLFFSLNQEILAVGAEQKNTTCLAKNDWAFLSHHIGDLKNVLSYSSFIQSILHLSKIFDIYPIVIAHDLHPQYLSTQCAKNPPPELSMLKGLKLMGIQHHHAHIASCMVENGLSEAVIGIALDGTGYGADGTIWGGEVLLADYYDFKRLAFLKPVAMPGADKAIHAPWRMGISYLYTVYGEKLKEHLPPAFLNIQKAEIDMVIYQIHNKLISPITTSCGRLFDGIAALAGICLNSYYEGQAAIEFEQLIESSDISGYNFSIFEQKQSLIIYWQEVIKQVLQDIKANLGGGTISYRFHRGLVSVLKQLCLKIVAKTKIKKIVLSGGCFMNMFLLNNLSLELADSGLNVFTHRKVPCNDGGICLGQIAIANYRIRGK